MIESSQHITPSAPSQSAVERCDDGFVVDAVLIGELLRVPAARVPALMQAGRITAACERGVDEHAGEFRLSFFYRNRRARLNTDLEGRILRRSTVDFGEGPMPGAPRRPLSWEQDPAEPVSTPAAGAQR
jgi:hypothetical protein